MIPEGALGGDASDPIPAPTGGTAVGKVGRCEEEGRSPANAREWLCLRQASFGGLVQHQGSPTHSHLEQ